MFFVAHSVVKVKSYTCYRVLGLELISLYRQVTTGSRLPLLLAARPAVTFPVKERHHPLTSTKLYCLMTARHICLNNLLQLVTQLCASWGIEPTTY